MIIMIIWLKGGQTPRYCFVINATHGWLDDCNLQEINAIVTAFVTGAT